MDISLFKATVFFYLLGTFGYLAYLIIPRKAVSQISFILLLSGFFSHTVSFIGRCLIAGYTPITNLYESLSFFSWTIVGFYFLLHLRYQLPTLGSFVSPFALLLVLSASVLPKEILPLPPVLRSFWLPIHVLFSFLGDGAFALAFSAGIMYLTQEYQIKRKKGGILYRLLPSLEVLDNLNYRCLTLGFPLLTVGIITGSIWAEYAWGSYWSWDPKETWSLITWLLYAALLHQRLVVGWRGKKAAIMAIVGFLSVIFTFLGVNLILPGLHSYL
jgi:cytochrome c-type biogenesis protein CcsB